MSTQQDETRRPVPIKKPDASELDRKCAKLGREIDDHLARLRGEGKS